ncbi:MAG: chemotaxis protein CheB [Thermodesulfovibrionales bacterium]
MAPADHHLLVKKNHVLVTRGPRENRMRPAIDPLFRSAAAAYGAKVVGVVLTGMLDDGTAGLFTVKRCGGVACVQDPTDALYPEMPQSALENVRIDYRLPVSELGPLLDHLARTDPTGDIPYPGGHSGRGPDSGKGDERYQYHRKHGHQVALRLPRMRRRHMGDKERSRSPLPLQHRPRLHRARTLLASQNETIERALWAAVRSLEERANMLKRLARDEKGRGRSFSLKDYATEADRQRKTPNISGNCFCISPDGAPAAPLSLSPSCRMTPGLFLFPYSRNFFIIIYHSEKYIEKKKKMPILFLYCKLYSGSHAPIARRNPRGKRPPMR